jgi:hypothetical protein
MGQMIGELFERPNLGQWGTRGDVYLWDELHKYLSDVESSGSEQALLRVLEDAFGSLTGHSLDEEQPFYLERLDPGHGMSAGYVSPDWWRQTGFALIMDRAWGAGMLKKFDWNAEQPKSIKEKRARFQELAARWHDETAFHSNLSIVWSHPAMQDIIDMGQDAIPLILEALQKRSDHWFYALSRLTGIDAGAGETTVEGARQKWLAWGREQGYLS